MKTGTYIRAHAVPVLVSVAMMASLLGGCWAAATVPVASPSGNQVGNLDADGHMNVEAPTSQPISNSGDQSGAAGGSHNTTFNFGAFRVDGVALAALAFAALLFFTKRSKREHRRDAKRLRAGK